jgi:hypothetical protein
VTIVFCCEIWKYRIRNSPKNNTYS